MSRGPSDQLYGTGSCCLPTLIRLLGNLGAGLAMLPLPEGLVQHTSEVNMTKLSGPVHLCTLPCAQHGGLPHASWSSLFSLWLWTTVAAGEPSWV